MNVVMSRRGPMLVRESMTDRAKACTGDLAEAHSKADAGGKTHGQERQSTQGAECRRNTATCLLLREPMQENKEGMQGLGLAASVFHPAPVPWARGTGHGGRIEDT